MKIGDKVHKIIHAGRFVDIPEGHDGTIIFINDKKRFYTVEFDIDGVKIRENYPFKEYFV